MNTEIIPAFAAATSQFVARLNERDQLGRNSLLPVDPNTLKNITDSLTPENMQDGLNQMAAIMQDFGTVRPMAISEDAESLQAVRAALRQMIAEIEPLVGSNINAIPLLDLLDQCVTFLGRKIQAVEDCLR